VVERSLLDRRARLLADASPALLDLGQPDARAQVLRAAHGGGAEPRYTTVLSVAELVRFPDLVLALTGIGRLLAAGGELVLVEPVHHPGVAATVFASCWSRYSTLSRVHVERDVPAAVRSTGLDITDLERFTMPTAVWPLRLFVEARSRRVVDQVAA
jgi:hypothetical protein